MTVVEIHHAARVQGAGCWQWNPQFGEQSLVATAELQPRHLSGTSIKGVRAAAEGAGATTALVMGFQELHGPAVAGQQRRSG